MSVVAAFVASLWLVALVFGVSYLVFLVVVAVHERNIPWSAWRIIITLVIIGVILALPSLPARTWEVQVGTQGPWSWPVTPGKDLNYFPVTDDPATGDEIDSLPPGSGNFTVSCWRKGKLTTKDGSITATNVDWVKVTGGRLDDLWIPYVAVNSENPGVARKLPRCDSWQGRWWPF